CGTPWAVGRSSVETSSDLLVQSPSPRRLLVSVLLGQPSPRARGCRGRRSLAPDLSFDSSRMLRASPSSGRIHSPIWEVLLPTFDGLPRSSALKCRNHLGELTKSNGEIPKRLTQQSCSTGP